MQNASQAADLVLNLLKLNSLTDVLNVMETILEEMWQQYSKIDGEECWCKNVTLFNCIVHWNLFREHPIECNMGLHIMMYLFHQVHEDRRAADLTKDSPQSMPNALVMSTNVNEDLV